MAAIYLRHPIHGAKVATMELEAVYDEGNGWERFDPTVAAPSETIADLRAAYTAKHGKKPFGGWDAETLKQKLG